MMTRQRLLFAIATVLLCATAYSLRPGQTRDLPYADPFLLGAALFSWAALWADAPRQAPTAPQNPPPPAAEPIRWRWLVGGMLCLALVSEINGTLWDIPLLMGASIHLQMALFVGGVWGVWRGLAGDSRRLWAIPPTEARLLGGILLLAFLLRVWNLEDSIRIPLDEAHMLDAVSDLRDNPTIAILSPFHPIARFPRLYPYWELITSEVFGYSLAGLRWASALVGVGGVAALYALGRALYNGRFGLWAAAMLAIYPPHLHFSRIGLLNIADPLLGTLALAALVAALRHGRRVHYVTAGACFALLFYFHESGKLLYGALGISWVLWSAIFGRHKPFARGLLALALCFGLLVAPYLYTFYAYRAPLTPRLAERGLDQSYLAVLLFTDDGLANLQLFFRRHISPPLMHVVHAPDSSAYFYGGDTALVLPIMLPFFLLGLLAAATRPRREGVLLWLWFLLTVLGNSLMDFPQWTARYVVAFPLIALLIGLGIWRAATLAAIALWPRGWRGRAGRIAAVAALALANVGYYFGPHLTTLNHQLRRFPDHIDVIYRIRDLDGVPSVFIFGDIAFLPHFDTLFRYWGIQPEWHAIETRHLTPRWLMKFSDARGLAFFIDPRDYLTPQWLNLLWELEGPYRSPYIADIAEQYVMYLAPSGSQRRWPPAQNPP